MVLSAKWETGIRKRRDRRRSRTWGGSSAVMGMAAAPSGAHQVGGYIADRLVLLNSERASTIAGRNASVRPAGIPKKLEQVEANR